MSPKDNQQITLPIFPLGYLLLPGEQKELRVFEARYKEMLNDCLENNACFGVVVSGKKDNMVSEYGTMVKILRVLKTTPAGESDILVEGVKTFRTVHFVPVLLPKLYGAATVEVNSSFDVKCSPDIVQLYARYARLIKETRSPTGRNITLFELARLLELSNEEKLRFISLSSPNRQKEFLSVKIKLKLLLADAEKKLNGEFWLN